MKNTVRTALALIGGFLGGFLVYELIVRMSLRMMDSVPIAFIGTLSMVMPIAGAIVALILIRRKK